MPDYWYFSDRRSDRCVVDTSSFLQAQMPGSLDLDVLREKLSLLEGEVSGDSPSTPRSRGSLSKDPEVGNH